MPLLQVLEQGQKIAEAIAAVLSVDVEIVDTFTCPLLSIPFWYGKRWSGL